MNRNKKFTRNKIYFYIELCQYKISNKRIFQIKKFITNIFFIFFSTLDFFRVELLLLKLKFGGRINEPKKTTKTGKRRFWYFFNEKLIFLKLHFFHHFFFFKSM